MNPKRMKEAWEIFWNSDRVYPLIAVLAVGAFAWTVVLTVTLMWGTYGTDVLIGKSLTAFFAARFGLTSVGATFFLFWGISTEMSKERREPPSR